MNEWLPFAEAVLNARRSFIIMHDDDRITNRRQRRADGKPEVVTTVTSDPATRAKIDAVPQGDGTYTLFDRMFDGYEVFVPWTSRSPLGMIETPSRRWSAATHDNLMAASAWALREHGPNAPADRQHPELRW